MKIQSWISTMFTLVMVAGTVATIGKNASAQAHDHAHEGHAHGDHAHSGETLAFQLPEWKTMHFDDAQKAAQHAETVKKLGCEMKQGSHAGHIDLSYRCANWKTLEVADHKLADQWSSWLAASGFDVSHSHIDPAFGAGPEAVEFRLVAWKQIHGNGSPEEAQLVDQLKRIGCDVVVEKHQGHSDIRFRAPTWRDIHLADHAAAGQWTNWLKQNGFEARHEH